MIVIMPLLPCKGNGNFPNSIGNLFPLNHCAQYSYHPSYMPGFCISMSEFYSTEGSQAILSKQQEYVLNLYNPPSPSNRLRAEAYLEGLWMGLTERSEEERKNKKIRKIFFIRISFLIFALLILFLNHSSSFAALIFIQIQYCSIMMTQNTCRAIFRNRVIYCTLYCCCLSGSRHYTKYILWRCQR